MAESPSSTSGKPSVEKLRWGLLITDAVRLIRSTLPLRLSRSSTENLPKTPVGQSHSTAEVMAEVVEETAASNKDAELQYAIERDLCQLTIEQSEMEGPHVKLEFGDVEEGSYLGTVRKGNRDEENDGKDSECVEDENENEREDKGNVGSKQGDGVRYNQSNNPRNNYSIRPDAEDCTFFMKFGSCKFGSNCRFNHPPRRKNKGVKKKANHREENSEKTGETECKYYLTSGGCKYGKNCKYSHGSDKSSTSHIPEFNFLGLPIRTGEKECPFYMRTGCCKYGLNCRFNHPDPVTVVEGDSPSGYGNGGSLPSQLFSSSSLFPPAQGVPTSNQGWSGYQDATYPTSESSLPAPPAFAMNNTEIKFPMHHQHDIVPEEYPERPGKKLQDCKFKSKHKFHHPKNRAPKAKANSYAK